MPTTVHIPRPLLEKVDALAKALELSRNRFIIESLERAVTEETAWSADFLAELDRFEPLDGENELLETIRKHRRSKGAPTL